jgi:phosphoenolpyruvate carboxykinase (ATP)
MSSMACSPHVEPIRFPNQDATMSHVADERTADAPGGTSLEEHGLSELGPLLWNPPPAELAERAVRKGEGLLSDRGALVFRTGKYTGRSPQDRFIVREPSTEEVVDWGPVNQPFDPARYDALRAQVERHLRGRELYVQDAFGGTDPVHRLPIRVICERAYHALFAHQLFVKPTREERERHRPEFTIIAVPDFQAEPARDGTRSEAFILLNFARREVLIGGTLYAGEIKKSVFGVLNTLLPRRGVLPMHCSANVGNAGDVALFFGLSGTGKTTLSADQHRHLIGDDEHGWSDIGIFNFEGGCYAKCIRLNRFNEPEIFGAIRFGTVLENVVLDPATRQCDFADATLTENTRAAYPIEFIPNFVPSGRGGHPRHVLFLTCDAFGVLPPLSRLSPEQAMYHFLSGYTAKVAGTERGLGREPQAVFSACFGAPFMTLPPRRYADLLGVRLRQHQSHAWLLNTGWTGGGYGLGQRMDLSYTRALVDAVLSEKLRDVAYATDPIFGLSCPRTCPNVPEGILDPRATWPNPDAYDVQARRLAGLFHENFARFPAADPAIRAAGPRS